jgi:SAM-dependent methyltransferase
MTDELTIREFTRQAASFEAPGSHFADLGVLDWIASQIDLGSEDRVLDVAGGTGQLGRHLARNARMAVVGDLTPAMLAAGSEAVRAQGRTDVLFVRADATALPFANGQFEVVVSRFALHHIDDLAGVVREMARVCVPGGTVALIDMVTETSEVGERFDRIERLRDPSHARTPRADELMPLLGAAGLEPLRTSQRDERLAAEPWLDRAQPGPGARIEVLDALRAEADGGAATGLHATVVDGELTISHRYQLAAAQSGRASLA